MTILRLHEWPFATEAWRRHHAREPLPMQGGVVR
ncbi:MAG: hypothetical protein QOJ21_4025 [Solirubrobacteraceae bacterium]|nr:hypothetical protein [Solirubrobacteraceae bacterium]